MRISVAQSFCNFAQSRAARHYKQYGIAIVIRCCYLVVNKEISPEKVEFLYILISLFHEISRGLSFVEFRSGIL